MRRLRHLLDALPGLIFTARADGRIEFLNGRWCEYTGTTLEASRGRGWQAALHADDLPKLLDGSGHFPALGEAYEVEARLRRVDGAYRWFSLRLSPLTDVPGKIATWCGTGTDIDNQKQAAEAVRASERRFRLIVDGFPAHVSIRTPAGDLEHVNRQFMEYAGSTLEQLKTRSWHDTWHPDDRPGARDAWRTSLQTGQPCEFEGRRRRADGVHRWFRMRGLPLRDADGRIMLWYLLQTDIEDWKRAEALLAGEKRLLEMVASGNALPLVLAALCQLVEETMSGCSCSVVLADDTDTGVSIDSVGKPGARWSTPIVSAGGVSLGTLSIHDREPATPSAVQPEVIEQFIHVAGIAIERARSEVALSKARSDLARVARVTSLGALTASIAHEVNQPLSGIITNASTCLRMLAADPPNVDGARETARRTIRDGQRASEVITRLRALFANENPVAELVDLNEATREVLALSSAELQRSRIIPRVELAHDLPAVKGNRVQLQQVVLNLLMNAADAMSAVHDRPREVIVKTASDDEDRVRVTVQDVGIGIDPKTAERLFDAFYTTKNGGMGIGLSTSRSIIESHEGRCLVLDVNLPDLDGLGLQGQIGPDRSDMPIIFITGYGDVPTTVRAMKAGAVEFLTKPFIDEVLVNAIRQALSRSHSMLDDASLTRSMQERYASLSPREREVMALVVAGRLNKQVGGALGISEITVKAHRGSAMRKMKARSLADLVRMAAKLDLAPAH